MKELKTIKIIAGPNGSGKSTFAESYFLEQLKVQHFINPDTIAAGIAPLNVESAAFQAGRIMITAIKEAIKKGESFAFESTLSGKTWFPILEEAVVAGYEITVYFIFLDKVQENIKRIKKRVTQGGHFIPPETVRRRYPKTFLNFWRVYRPLCKNWFVFNNSGRQPKRIQDKATFELLSPQGQRKFEALFLKGKAS